MVYLTRALTFMRVASSMMLLVLGACDSDGDSNNPFGGTPSDDPNGNETDPWIDDGNGGEYSPTGLVAERGAIQVSGSRFLDKHGQPIQVKGLSLYWSNLNAGQDAYFNADLVKWLAAEWNISLIRAPLGVETDNRALYTGMTEEEKAASRALVDNVVKGALEAGIYVIIDWHDHDALKNEDLAFEFFEIMGAKWGSYPNVIFEIWNEPYHTDQYPEHNWDNIKAYAERALGVLRKHTQNLVLVGTPNYSWDISAPGDNPIVGDPNVAYVLHFYEGLHGFVPTVEGHYYHAKAAELPVFVSEWGLHPVKVGDVFRGYVDGHWHNPVDAAVVDPWIDWMNGEGLSWAMWSLGSVGEGSAMLNFGASPQGGWTDDDLRTVGQYIKTKFP